MLNTRIQRIGLVVLVCGAAICTLGLYQWLRPHRHHWILETQYIPDYPFDYMGASPTEDAGLIQQHRACEWTAKSENDHRQMESMKSDNVIVQDYFLTIDGACAKSQIEALSPRALFYAISSTESGSPNPFWNAKLSAGYWDYENLALFRGIGANSYFGSEDPKSGREYYKIALKDEIQKTGYEIVTANAIADRCVRAEQRWCIEKHRVTRFHVWQVVVTDLTLCAGAILLLAGTLGTFLLNPLFWIWTNTAGAVIRWIKRGE